MPNFLSEFFSRLVSSFSAASGSFPTFDLHHKADRMRSRMPSGSFSLSGSSLPVYETSDFSRHFQGCLSSLSGMNGKSCQKERGWPANFRLVSGIQSVLRRNWKRIFSRHRLLSLLVGNCSHEQSGSGRMRAVGRCCQPLFHFFHASGKPSDLFAGQS